MLPDVSHQRLHSGPVAVAAHQQDASDELFVLGYKGAEELCRELLPYIVPQVGAVAPLAMVGAVGDVDGE